MPILAHVPVPSQTSNVWALGEQTERHFWDFEEEGQPAGVVTEWYCEVPDWCLSGAETQATRVASFWTPIGPCVLKYCWKWVRPTREHSGEQSESERSAKAQDKEASDSDARVQWAGREGCRSWRHRKSSSEETVLSVVIGLSHLIVTDSDWCEHILLSYTPARIMQGCTGLIHLCFNPLSARNDQKELSVFKENTKLWNC